MLGYMQPVDPGANREGAGKWSGLETYAVIKKKADIARLGNLNFIQENCEQGTRSGFFSTFPT